MNVFLSFASEQKDDAELIAVALRDRGHTVFFSKDTLPAAQTFDLRIEQAVAAADLVIFLVSPQSVARGKYTLTELTFVKQKWRNPGGHVLPVMVVNTPIEIIPSYLRAVGILEPEGSVAADTASQADKLLVKGGQRRLTLFAIAGLVSGVLTYFACPPANSLYPVGLHIPARFSLHIPGSGAPIMCGVVFGILVAGCNWVFGLREKLIFVALVTFTTIAWVLAWESTMSIQRGLGGFVKEIIQPVSLTPAEPASPDTTPAEPASPDTTPAEPVPKKQYLPFTGVMSGFVGGLVGGAVTVFGISIVNRRFRRIQELLPVIVAATVLGGLVEVITATEATGGNWPVDGALLLLFVSWQTAVIVLIARVLAASQVEL